MCSSKHVFFSDTTALKYSYGSMSCKIPSSCIGMPYSDRSTMQCMALSSPCSGDSVQWSFVNGTTHLHTSLHHNIYFIPCPSGPQVHYNAISDWKMFLYSHFQYPISKRTLHCTSHIRYRSDNSYSTWDDGS